MQGADKGIEQELDGTGLHIGIVQARFNEGITNALAVACIRELEDLGVHDIDHVLVPGALEVPIALQAMAERGEYDALVALGCIIRGETYHFELVANESGAGVSRIALDYNVPIANAFSPLKTWNRPLRVKPKKVVMPPAWPLKWPCCWKTCLLAMTI
jgi:6,7-dimethyl-8-ribityllumazine synthase